MGCGGSKSKGPKSKKTKVLPQKQSKNGNDLLMDDVDDDALTHGNHGQEPPASSLLASWDRPTNNAAHARIIKTVGDEPTAHPSKKRGRPAARPDSMDTDDAYDSSDDEEDTHRANVAPQGQPAVHTAPGMVQDRPNLLSMFRPQTPNAMMDLD